MIDSADAQLDDTDRQLLVILQHQVPLVPRPFEQLGRQLELAEADVIERLRRLKDLQGVIRQISAIFDSAALGYRSVLVAARYHPTSIDAAATIINRHPGVSHNYHRSGPFNLWYTLTLPPDSRLGLEKTVALLGRLSRAERSLLLPALKRYKLSAVLALQALADGAEQVCGSQAEPAAVERRPARLSPADIPAIRALQLDLPIEPACFEPLAEAAGCSVEQLLAAARRFLADGLMRRFAAVLHHQQAGFQANVLAAWAVPEDRADQLGTTAATFEAVSHCYRRPTYPDWPYSVLAMVHGRSRRQCLAVLDAISQAAGPAQRCDLWSLRQYKKTRVQYFAGQIEQWEAEHAG